LHIAASCIDADHKGDWDGKVGDLMAVADTCILILSPEAVPAFDREIQHAVALSKRIVPVLCRPMRDIELPDELEDWQVMRFKDKRSFDVAHGALDALLSRDRGWLQDHTRLLLRALEWDAEGRPSHLLLSNDEVVEAKIWALSRPDNAPTPTDLHVTFVCVSEAVETAKQLAKADIEEAKTISMMQEMQSKGQFRRRANQVFMVIGYAAVILTLVSSSTYVVAKCTQPSAKATTEIFKQFN
jgi:hypothetical protein